MKNIFKRDINSDIQRIILMPISSNDNLKMLKHYSNLLIWCLQDDYFIVEIEYKCCPLYSNLDIIEYDSYLCDQFDEVKDIINLYSIRI